MSKRFCWIWHKLKNTNGRRQFVPAATIKRTIKVQKKSDKTFKPADNEKVTTINDWKDANIKTFLVTINGRKYVNIEMLYIFMFVLTAK
uniref:Uncharacterized protein n=1 Tax=Meloidogyne enterolobii TaxID=390850 RepID=A0A6V7TLC4_MELEN|nr:unnamed protein product [Meloidogyne enterolobii]